MQKKNENREPKSSRKESKTKVAPGTYKMDENSFSFGPEWGIYPNGRGHFVRRTRTQS